MTAGIRPILWLTDSPGFGGSEVNLIRVLRMTANEPSVVAVPSVLSLEFRKALNSLNRPIETLNTAGSLKAMPTAMHRVRTLLDRYPKSPAIIWSHYTDSNRWAQAYMSVIRRPFAVVEQYIPAGREELAASKTSIPLKRWVGGGASAIVLNAHSQRDHYRRLFGVGGSKVRVIPNSRPVAAIAERVRELRTQKRALRQSLELTPEGWVVVCIARLTAVKQQATLLRSWKSIDDPDARLVLVGDGPDRAMLQPMADDRVMFAGHIDDPIPWLAAADAFVLPSKAEGLPGALIEAMAAGLPCIATDIPGNRELVRHEETGLRITAGSHGELTKAMSRLKTDQASAKKYADAGQMLVSRCYDEPSEQLTWMRLIRDLRSSR